MKKTILLTIATLSLSFAQSNLDFNTEVKKCKKGSGESCLHIGDMFANGKNDITTDYFSAAKYYKLSCKKGEGEGCYMLSQCHEKGNSVPVSPKMKKKYLKKSCKLKYQKACNELKQLK